MESEARKSFRDSVSALYLARQLRHGQRFDRALASLSARSVLISLIRVSVGAARISGDCAR